MSSDCIVNFSVMTMIHETDLVAMVIYFRKTMHAI